jgi:ubiquinone/menaquinone biosynthesis C-methylase UbiE
MIDSDHPLDVRNPYKAVDARLYDRVRPAYPDASLAMFALELRCVGGRVLDIACGTGALVRGLATAGCRLTGVDIAIGMLQGGPARSSVVCGEAELLPFMEAGFDAVTIGQAFHWLEPQRTLAEIARVLVPNGRLGMIWNFRDVDTDLERMIDKCVQQYCEPPLSSWRGVESWPSIVESAGSFRFVREESTKWSRHRTHDDVVSGVLTRSHVAALATETQRVLAAELLDRLRTLPEVAASYTTRWYAFVKAPPHC